MVKIVYPEKIAMDIVGVSGRFAPHPRGLSLLLHALRNKSLSLGNGKEEDRVSCICDPEEHLGVSSLLACPQHVSDDSLDMSDDSARDL